MNKTNWSKVPDIWEYKDGNLYWRIKCGRGVAVKNKGDLVSVKPDSLGYKYVTWQRKHYAVHRIVFLLSNGWLPDCVDHIDNNPSNNVADNLRAATLKQNQYNRRINDNSKTKIKNVTPHKNKWAVRFFVNGKTKHFGVFEDIELAELVAHEIRDLIHKDFARHA